MRQWFCSPWSLLRLLLAVCGVMAIAQWPDRGAMGQGYSRVDAAEAWVFTTQDHRTKAPICSLEPPRHVLEFYAGMLIDRERAAEREVILRLPGRACRFGQVLYLRLADGGALKMFDEGDHSSGYLHYLRDYWPEMGAYVVVAWVWGKDPSVLLVDERNGSIHSLEGDHIRSPSGKAVLFQVMNLYDYVAVATSDNGLEVFRLNISDVSRDCDAWQREAQLGWISESVIDLGEIQDPFGNRRLRLVRSPGGQWDFQC